MSKKAAGSLNKVLFVPDAHIPYHDKRAMACMMEAANIFRPDTIVVLGDWIDCYAVSSYPKNPKREKFLKREIDEARDLLGELYSVGGDRASRRIFVEGNHEVRLKRTVREKVPALDGLLGMQSLLGADNWEYVSYGDFGKVGKLLVTHDLNRYGQNAVRMARADTETNIVIGHVHRMELFYAGCAFGSTKVAACFGWLGDHKKVDYRHRIRAAREWQHGFGIGYMEQNGTVHIQAIPIIKGRCCINGQIVSA